MRRHGETMAPITIPETTFERTDTVDYLHCKLNHTKKNHVDNYKQIFGIDPYDAVLGNDPEYLRPVRRLEKKFRFVTPIRWVNTFAITTLHLLTVYLSVTMLLFAPDKIKWQTSLFALIIGQIAGFGVTAGAHRYWCHRSYKAKLPLQIILAFCFSIAGQNTIYDWVRDHRVHHKHSETSADPHNANRGFFFSHVGWLMMKKHPDVIKEGAKINMTDIQMDPVIKFHTKYFTILKLLFCWIIPTLMPVYIWDETWAVSIASQVFLRYTLSLNFTWSVNSFAHLWGNKPYDENIMPAENIGVAIVAIGEGWHNYHHTFPWDYKASEFGTFLNATTCILNLFAAIGWAHDMKQASPALIRTVINRKKQNTPHKSLYITK